MALILTPLEKAVSSLEKALAVIRGPFGREEIIRTELRDSAIQRFEYTYELCFGYLVPGPGGTPSLIRISI